MFDCAGTAQAERDSAVQAAVRTALEQANRERDAALQEQRTRLQRMHKKLTNAWHQSVVVRLIDTCLVNAGTAQAEREAAVRTALEQANRERDAALQEQQTRLQRMQNSSPMLDINLLQCSQITVFYTI